VLLDPVFIVPGFEKQLTVIQVASCCLVLKRGQMLAATVHIERLRIAGTYGRE
jgi:hypothetical protein